MNDKTVEENLGLVHACCKRFTGRGIDYEELYCAGCLGLVKAVRRFKPELGLQLSTYAVPVILGEIKLLFREGSTVKVSRGLKDLSMKLRRFSDNFSAEHDREPTVSEAAQALGVSVEKVADALSASRPVLSLTADSDDDDGQELDIKCDDIADKVTERLALRQALNSLDEDDRRIIELRYFQGLTQTKTAERLNLTQVQISRREKKILTLMRARMG